MKNFIIFFDEKEGTTAIVSLLDRLNGISVVKSSEDLNWEPFDKHSCGAMPIIRLFRCLGLLYRSNGPVVDRLNTLYQQTTGTSLQICVSKVSSMGLKMRLQPHWRPVNAFLDRIYTGVFRHLMFAFLRIRRITVFVAVRRDILRWALSKYHGDGTGQPGHIQFKLASNEITKNEIVPIHVDCDRLADIIQVCEDRHHHKHRIIRRMRKYGIPVHLLYYEDFLANPRVFLTDFRWNLGLSTNDADIDTALSQNSIFRKVHSDNISEFVINHEEVSRRFDGAWITWDSPEL